MLDPFSINKQKSTTFPIQIQIHIYIYVYCVPCIFPNPIGDFHFHEIPISNHCHPATLLTCADASTKTGSIWCWMFLQQGDRIAPVALTRSHGCIESHLTSGEKNTGSSKGYVSPRKFKIDIQNDGLLRIKHGYFGYVKFHWGKGLANIYNI